MDNKLWNWAHLETSHNYWTKQYSDITIEGFAEEFNIKNAFVVSFRDNINPPFDRLADRLTSLNDIKWSIMGDASSSIPEEELGYTEYIIDVAKTHPNITGAVIDDFFSPKRIEKFTPEVLRKIQARLHENNLDFWGVLYADHVGLDEAKKYYDCFDGLTYWLYTEDDVKNMEALVDKFMEMFPNHKKMLGIYTYDYAGHKERDTEQFKTQLGYCKKYLDEGKIDGVIFCSGCIGDLDIEANHILKDFAKE